MNIKNSHHLYGLVLAGGKGTRMQADKGSLNYHGKSQTEFGVDLLTRFCEKVFISNRADQTENEGQKQFPQIHDHPQFAGQGPMSGILSALHEHPAVGWLVLACDLPFLTPRIVADLVRQRDPTKTATAYRSATDCLPEPLCTIYEPSARQLLLSAFQQGKYCPRKFLINADVQLLELADKQALDNVNTPEEFRKAKTILKAPKK